MRSPLPLLAILVSAALTGCGEPAAPTPVSAVPTAPPPLLTMEELTALFLEGAQVWKFTAQPGLAAKSVRLQLIDDGKPILILERGDQRGKHVTSVIVVSQQFNEQHVLKFYVKRNDGSSLSTSGAWFSKPLKVWGHTAQTVPALLQTGTETLLSGISEKPESGKSYSLENAPSRLELVIE